MRISIRDSNNSYIIEFNQFVVSGREAVGGYAFTFTMRGCRQACETPISIFDISLSLSLSGATRPLITSVPSSIQVLKCHKFPNNSEQLLFETVLTKEQVNALEEYRQEQDLTLNVGLRALMSSAEGLLSHFDTTDILIPREQWLNALKSAGFRQTLLFEIPLPSVSENLSAILSKAQEFIETGHYNDAVTQCRKIIEALEGLRGDKGAALKANKKLVGNGGRQSMTVIERMLAMREQVKNICQLGVHGDEPFTRSQARAVLAATLSLLAEPTVGFASSDMAADTQEDDVAANA